jgi:hypothetical protein
VKNINTNNSKGCPSAEKVHFLFPSFLSQIHLALLLPLSGSASLTRKAKVIFKNPSSSLAYPPKKFTLPYCVFIFQVL